MSSQILSSLGISLILLLTTGADPSFPAEDPVDEQVAQDTCILELTVPSEQPPNDGRPELVLQTGHTASVNSVTFSHDGRHVLTGSSDNRAILWESATGRKLRIFRGHKMHISSVDFSLDGQTVLTGSWDGTAILWDAATAKEIRVLQGPRTGVKNAIYSVALSSDGQHAVTASSDKRAVLWDTATGARIRTLDGHTNVVLDVALSADGRKVLTSSYDQTSILWDALTGRRVHTFQGHTSPVASGALSSDGHLAVTGSYDKTAILWDAKDGKLLRALQGHAEAVNSVAFSPDDRHVVTGSDDATSILWETASGRSLRSFQGHSGKIHSVAFSPTGRQMVAGCEDGTAILWDLATGETLRKYRGKSQCVETLRRYRGNSQCVTAAVCSPDGQRILTGSSDTTAVLWDASIGRKQSVFGGHVERLVSVAFGPEGRQILTGSCKGPHFPPERGPWTASLWDGATGKNVRTFRQDDACIYSIAFGPAGGRVLTSGFTSDQRGGAPSSIGQLTLWDVTTGQKLHTFEGHKPGVYAAAAFSPDGRYVLAGSENNTATLWDAGAGQVVQTFRGHTALLDAVAFRSDGQRILTGARDNTAILWDVATGKALRVFEAPAYVQHLAFNPKGDRFVTGLANHSAILWDAADGKKLETFVGHSSWLSSVAFTPNGRHVLTASQDGTARLWDIDTGNELLRLISLDQGRDWLVSTPDGLFDGSANAREMVMFRVGGGLNVVPVDRFFQDFYYPGLLAAIWRGQRPRPDVEIGRILPPAVRILSPEQGGLIEERSLTVEVEATDEGGGVRGPWLAQNSVRVVVPGKTVREDKMVRRTFEVMLVEGENELKFQAASADGSWESEPVVITFRYERPLPKPQLYLVSVGVNRYAEESMSLQYAVADATAMAELFQKRAPALYRQVHVSTLIDEEATAAAIRETIRDFSQTAQPQDTVAVFFAGHGTMVGGQYYFLPHDFTRQADSLEEDVRKQGLLAGDVGEALVTVPALKRMVVFDTGQSGGRVGLTRTTRNPFAFRGAVERLSRAQGAFTIASAAVSDQAAEVPELGHGVLTYTLLAGLHAVEGGPLEKEWIQPSANVGVAHVLEWFGFASSRVPQLTRRYFGRQQDVQHASAGTNFPVLPVPISAEAPQATATYETTPRPSFEPSAVVTGVGDSNLYLVAIGVNRYADEAMNLQFASDDAKAMAELFRTRGAAAYQEVHAKTLFDREANNRTILATLEEICQRAQPEDTLAVFLAGHGRVVGQRYYFIPHEFRRKTDSLEEDVREQGLAADVLADAVSNVPALKRLLIFDTCASGGALEINRQGTDPFAFRGAIEQLGRRQGIFTIAASGAGQEAQEISELGHGVLTYSLLAGLGAVTDAGPLEGLVIHPTNPDGRADVLEWFSYASGHVPRLTRRYLGREQDVQIGGQGASFPLLPLEK